jgi:hypothetical protein
MRRTVSMPLPVRVAALGAVVAGLALTQGCAGTAAAGTTPAGSPVAAQAKPATAAAKPAATSAATSAASPKASSDAAILAGRRQINLKLVQDPDGVLAVDRAGRIDLSDTYGRRALFVLVPNGDTHLIKTGAITQGGEALCASLQRNGTNPLTIVTTACDASDSAQQWTVQRYGKDSNGKRAYALSAAGAYVQWFRYGTNGVIAEELGDSTLETSFTFTDRGVARIPSLD